MIIRKPDPPVSRSAIVAQPLRGHAENFVRAGRRVPSFPAWPFDFEITYFNGTYKDGQRRLSWVNKSEGKRDRTYELRGAIYKYPNKQTNGKRMEGKSLPKIYTKLHTTRVARCCFVAKIDPLHFTEAPCSNRG